ncbi:MAG: transcription antitermination factor NusB [Bacteroidaceae bacterium]|nr:transcription antitermination factor NusB [Bacteroidaceae bacterium]
MINRELIRLKVIQITYAFYESGMDSVERAEDELFKSLSQSHDLYLYLMQLIVEVHRIAERAVDTAESRFRRLGEGEPPSHKFINNKFVEQLEVNATLQDFTEHQKKSWIADEDFVRRLYKTIVQSDTYKEWMESPQVETTYEQQRDLWRKLYKNVIIGNEDLDQVLEEKNVYWNDDRFIIDSFVLKTIKQFEPQNGAHQELLPEFRDDEDREFARKLLRMSLLSAETYRTLISQFLHNWELDRLAFMDLLILQTAVAELFAFPRIPINVTINEYVEIAKMYSTPRSGAYINGLLDAIAHRLIEEGKLKKDIAPKGNNK